MSSFLAKLTLDGKEYTILDCEYNLYKTMKANTQPANEVKGGEITLTIESQGDVSLIEWMIATNKEKDGSILFYKKDAMSRLLEIQFQKAHCVQYHEKFTSQDNQPMKITLTLVARKLKFNHVELNNNWGRASF